MLGMSSDNPKQPPDASRLSREAVIDAALALLETAGVEGLSMRALADRLDIKPASLYWHLRDKGQLVELLAGAVLDSVEVPAGPSWRARIAAACDALTERLATRPASADVVLACLPAVPRSRLSREIASVLSAAGAEAPEAAANALVIAAVGVGRLGPGPNPPSPKEAVTLAIDSGSWKVQVRAAAAGTVDLATSTGGGGAPSLDVRPDGEVVVRNRRGGYRGAVELSPERTWRIKVHGGTWNTSLDLRGLRISEIELDSGAGNVSCTLPPPFGAVPIKVNSGIVGVTLHRPRGAAARATVSTGSVRVRLDARNMRSTGADAHWESPGASRSENRYELSVYSGCVKVSLDDSAPEHPRPLPQDDSAPRDTAAPPGGQAVSLMLDGIERRLAG
ncbi:MAG: TetR family transcriptional regulator [Candidatus Dormibacteraeota bacterium]|nr:TetR family transcriptional regulator [Candidatus Dormibacteraeota bacterium]MBV9526421.1 TetR family transcriptional regulator [Candidatus Dormibacteraeota bacterium]